MIIHKSFHEYEEFKTIAYICSKKVEYASEYATHKVFDKIILLLFSL